MDNLKLHARNEKALDTLIQIGRAFNKDIGMKFRVRKMKCTVKCTMPIVMDVREINSDVNKTTIGSYIIRSSRIKEENKFLVSACKKIG